MNKYDENELMESINENIAKLYDYVNNNKEQINFNFHILLALYDFSRDAVENYENAIKDFKK